MRDFPVRLKGAFAGATLITVIAMVLMASPGWSGAHAAKPKRVPHYSGSVTASGRWQQTTSTCNDTFYDYQSDWSLQAVYGKTVLEPTAEMDWKSGSASGNMTWTGGPPQECNHDPGSCPVVLDPYLLPIFFNRVKGGLYVDFDLPLTGTGCGTAQVYPYGSGFESDDRVSVEPHGFIPKKKIGQKVINVAISGTDMGSAGQGTRAFNGSMSGTLKLTRRH